MNNTLKVIALAGAICGSSVTASAVTYQDVDVIDKLLLQDGGSHTGEFNIVTGDGDANVVIAGYDPVGTNGSFSDLAGFVPGGTLNSAFAFFYLRDANQGQDAWDIDVTLDSTFLGGDGNLSGVSAFTHFDQVTGASFNFLNQNGVISYTVTNTSTNNGNGAQFTLEFARLTATAADAPNGVPDGGMTAALLGLSMTGLAMVRRKFGV